MQQLDYICPRYEIRVLRQIYNEFRISCFINIDLLDIPDFTRLRFIDFRRQNICPVFAVSKAFN